MINLVQTQVMFNQEVDADSAETAGNYTITDTDDNDIAITDAQLLEDGKTVELKGNEEVEYDGETHTAANLFDALKEGYYGKF